MNVGRVALPTTSVKSRKRRYDTTRRQATAQETRRRILDAALRLFLDRGYTRTTVEAIATEASVSIETVYLSVGGKASLVRYLVETAISGTDQPVQPRQRPGVMEIHAEPDPRLKLKLFARMVRPMLERLAPIWLVVLEAAPTDTELRSLVDQLLERRAASMRLVIKQLTENRPLRPEISKDVARDVVWAMNSPEFYRLMVVGCGWTGEIFEEWLADAWERLLFDDDHASTRRLRK